ncbi:MAG: hypothetical protein WAL41_22120 [Mycobacterium sp.]
MSLEGEEWVRQRRLIGSAPHTRHAARYKDRIGEIVAERLRLVPVGTPIALREVMQDMTLEVILRVVFGIGDADRQASSRTLIPQLAETAVFSVTLSALSASTWAGIEQRSPVAT